MTYARKPGSLLLSTSANAIVAVGPSSTPKCRSQSNGSRAAGLSFERLVGDRRSLMPRLAGPVRAILALHQIYCSRHGGEVLE